MKKIVCSIGVLLSMALSVPLFASTVLYQDNVVTVDDVLADPNDLWVSPKDLTRINGFELKPEGI